MSGQFDWYQATIPLQADDVVREYQEGLPGCSGTEISERGGHGYRNTVVFLDSRGDELSTMMHGGNQFPNIKATSHRAPAAARLIRKLWPIHRVTRLDVAIDYAGTGVFDHLLGLARDIVERNRIKTGLMYQPDLLHRGRTYRIGSPSSPVIVRLYEKGLMEIGRGYNEDPDWTRLEIQVRPQKEAKTAFARVGEADAWGATRWTKQLIGRVLGEEPKRIDVDPRPESEWERTQAALVAQYGRHAIAGGFRAAGDGEHVTIPQAIDAYLAILKKDLVEQARNAGKTAKTEPSSRRQAKLL